MKQIEGSIYKELVNSPTKKTSFSDRYEQSVLFPPSLHSKNVIHFDNSFGIL